MKQPDLGSRGNLPAVIICYKFQTNKQTNKMQVNEKIYRSARSLRLYYFIAITNFVN